MNSVAKVAAKLIQARRDGGCVPSDELGLNTEADAYLVQQLVGAELRWYAADDTNAWKLGGSPGNLVSTAIVPPDAIHPSGWKVPAGYCQRYGIEAELIVRLGRDLDEHADLRDAHSAVEAWHVGIELCDTRFIDGENAHPLLRLADQQLNRALILGDSINPTSDWIRQGVQLRLSGSLHGVNVGSHPFTDPLTSVPWLARYAASQGRPLKAGDLIATGSWTGLVWAPPASEVRVEFLGLGGVSLFTP